MQIYIFKNLFDLHHFCAQTILAQIKTKPNSVLGFATGVSPILMYQLLVKDHQTNHTSWKAVTTFNLDEFMGISPDHKEAFIQQMQTNLFQHLDLLNVNIHIPNCQAQNFEQEAADYEKLITEKGPIDLQYITLGINGHMAYCEPNTPFDSVTHVAKLAPATIDDLIAKKKFANYEECPKQAITMGIQTLLTQTKKMLMVSFGSHKAAMTKAMLEDTPNSLVTASYLQTHKNCIFVLDEQAAALLSDDLKKNAIYK